MNNTLTDFDTQMQCEEFYQGITEIPGDEYMQTMIELNVRSLQVNVWNN